jgi:hypothetical protein
VFSSAFRPAVLARVSFASVFGRLIADITRSVDNRSSQVVRVYGH